jgi:uncharacterized protein YyaL (SSP411 family)
MPNRLINEQSLYLLQHANNPVDWYPWGDAAFERAKAENKPVIVSIGYAACHWCHVMEHESFEDEATAAYMNEHFVCIKVDREEHPDVDHMYMDAVQAISGSGGWPLNVFVTPGRVPFYGGTYYPPRPAYNRPSWLQLMQRMVDIWQQQPDEVTAQAAQMVKYLENAATAGTQAAGTDWDKDSCRKMAETLLQMADSEDGGFGRAPKFPGTMAISYLLEHYHFTGHEPSLQHALHSLDAMIDGGIYDQLGGGLARYATDNKWLVPHFEKMLYDNALLVLALCDAYSIAKTERYKLAIEDTIAFVERELKGPSGGYYSALDADSEGVEGKFYTFTWQEWTEVLGAQEHDVLAEHFGVTPEGNWEEVNILHVAQSIAGLAMKYGVPEADLEEQVSLAKSKLLAYRSRRIRPATDDKSLLSWNALMNLALTKAAVVLENAAYEQLAAGHMQWMLAHFYINNIGMMHVWKDGVARVHAHLDDYAYLVQAMIQLASLTGDNELLLRAAALQEAVNRDFRQEDGVFFYFTSGTHTQIPVRKVDLYDGAIPSANAVTAHNLLLLGLCMEHAGWTDQAYRMLQQTAQTILRYTYSFGYWAMLMQRYTAGIKTAVCSGPESNSLAAGLRKNYIPQCYILMAGAVEKNKISLLSGKYSETGNVIFICRQDACLAPVSDTRDAIRLITV